jgi:hypothetical protein
VLLSLNCGLILLTALLTAGGVAVISGDKITQIGLEIPGDGYQLNANA